MTISICYYWETLGPTEGDFKAFVHLVDPAGGTIVVQDDHALFPRVYPSSAWQPGRYLYETRTIALPKKGYTGSKLAVRVGLYRDDTRLPVTSSDVQGATSADVATITIPR